MQSAHQITSALEIRVSSLSSLPASAKTVSNAVSNASQKDDLVYVLRSLSDTQGRLSKLQDQISTLQQRLNEELRTLDTRTRNVEAALVLSDKKIDRLTSEEKPRRRGHHSRSPGRHRRKGSAATDTEAKINFSVGDLVQYYSVRRGRWENARVMSLCEDGRIDLDIRSKTHHSRLRPVGHPEETPQNPGDRSLSVSPVRPSSAEQRLVPLSAPVKAVGGVVNESQPTSGSLATRNPLTGDGDAATTGAIMPNPGVRYRGGVSLGREGSMSSIDSTTFSDASSPKSPPKASLPSPRRPPPTHEQRKTALHPGLSRRKSEPLVANKSPSLVHKTEAITSTEEKIYSKAATRAHPDSATSPAPQRKTQTIQHIQQAQPGDPLAQTVRINLSFSFFVLVLQCSRVS